MPNPGQPRQGGNPRRT